VHSVAPTTGRIEAEERLVTAGVIVVAGVVAGGGVQALLLQFGTGKILTKFSKFNSASLI
jgi:hypothetical protein